MAAGYIGGHNSIRNTYKFFKYKYLGCLFNSRRLNPPPAGQHNSHPARRAGLTLNIDAVRHQRTGWLSYMSTFVPFSGVLVEPGRRFPRIYR